MPEDYPETLLKGIPKQDLIEGQRVVWTAFIPPSGNAVNGWKESSINWEDDDGAIEQLRSQRKNGRFQFEPGIVRLFRSEVDAIIKDFNAHEKFRYERNKIDGNDYHGNLLFSENIRSELRITICGALSRNARLI